MECWVFFTNEDPPRERHWTFPLNKLQFKVITGVFESLSTIPAPKSQNTEIVRFSHVFFSGRHFQERKHLCSCMKTELMIPSIIQHFTHFLLLISKECYYYTHSE